MDFVQKTWLAHELPRVNCSQLVTKKVGIHGTICILCQDTSKVRGPWLSTTEHGHLSSAKLCPGKRTCSPGAALPAQKAEEEQEKLSKVLIPCAPGRGGRVVS